METILPSASEHTPLLQVSPLMSQLLKQGSLTDDIIGDMCGGLFGILSARINEPDTTRLALAQRRQWTEFNKRSRWTWKCGTGASRLQPAC